MRLTRREAKYLRSLQQKKVRQHERKFVLEGWRAVAEALHAAAAVEYVAVAGGDHAEGHAEVLSGFRSRGVPVREADAALLELASGTVQTQGVLALVAQQRWSVEEVLRPEASLVVALDGVADPGNLGTLLRSAEASGARGMVIGAGTVDAYNPKVVRASAGAIFGVPLVVASDAEGWSVTDALDELRSSGRTVFGTRAIGGARPDAVDLSTPVAVLLGNEAHGLVDEVDGHVDGWISVPMAGSAESLNVAMAGTVVCFEAARQRAVAAGGR